GVLVAQVDDTISEPLTEGGARLGDGNRLVGAVAGVRTPVRTAAAADHRSNNEKRTPDRNPPSHRYLRTTMVRHSVLDVTFAEHGMAYHRRSEVSMRRRIS